MKHEKVIDEYDLEAGEFDRLEPFLKTRGFYLKDVPQIPFEFTEASAIVDSNENSRIPCGRIINYPWGHENKGLHVFRGTRLEEAIKEYLKKF
jgi:hypothetical protein